MLGPILSVLNSIAAVVVVLGLCLFFHEAGHFLVAKLCRMKVEEFAFGFGKPLWQRRWGETLYRINVAPFGGFVKIAGMEPGASVVERGFHSRPRWMGALVIIAGSASNVVLAMLLFTSVVIWTGVPDPNDQGVYVGKVPEGTPADQAGIEVGDRIVAVGGERRSLQVAAVDAGSLAARLGLKPHVYIEKVNGKEVFVPSEMLAAVREARGGQVRLTAVDLSQSDIRKQQTILEVPVDPALRQASQQPAFAVLHRWLGATFAQLSDSAVVGYIAARRNQPVWVTTVRAGRELQFRPVTTVATARYAERDDAGMLRSTFREVGRLGVVLRPAMRHVTVLEGVDIGLKKSMAAVVMVVLSIRAMVQRQVEAELAGPVAIMAISVERAQVGWDEVLNWGGIISAILAVINLLPIPPFDGFRVVLTGFEGVIQRRIGARSELIISIAGFVLVLFVFVALTFKDVANLVRYGTP